jgi:hypothetical protein
MTDENIAHIRAQVRAKMIKAANDVGSYNDLTDIKSINGQPVALKLVREITAIAQEKQCAGWSIILIMGTPFIRCNGGKCTLRG